jgi:hypothetical protein
MKKTYSILFIFFLSLPLNAQNEMLIRQLSNRLVIRENFNKNNSLHNKQTFNVGKVKEINNYYEIEVVTELFDENGESTDKYTTTYRCKPDESSIMVMAFPFLNPKSKETEINITSKNFKELYDLDNLEDIEMEINFDSGFLDLFGSKSEVKIYDRKLESNESSIRIESKLNVKAYVLGIRFKRLDYTVIEKLSLEGLLSYQKFIEEDGSYFTMTYKN